MKRRSLLSALVLAPWWLRSAFGDASVAARGAVAPSPVRYAEALARARRAAKPLLVFVIPDDDREKYRRGRAFGEWLNHGSDVEVAPLAEVEVVCLGLGEIGVYDGPSDPLMLLIDSRDAWPTNRPTKILSAPLPEYDSDRSPFPVRTVGTAVPDETIFHQRVSALSRLLAGELPPIAPDRAHELAERARSRLRDRPPANAHWAKSSGCGTQVEPTPEEIEAEERRRREEAKQGRLSLRGVSSVGCGMGHVPEKSRRFLYLFAKTPD